MRWTGPADCFAVVEEKKLRSSRVVFNLDDELVEARLRLIGRHNVYNALAAAAGGAKTRGGRRCDRAGHLAHAGGGTGGSNGWPLTRGADIFVDFAHTPDGP